jgi:hypothetical protein
MRIHKSCAWWLLPVTCFVITSCQTKPKVVATDSAATSVHQATTSEDKHPFKLEGDFADGNAPTDVASGMSMRGAIEDLLNKHAQKIDLRKLVDYVDKPTKDDFMLFKSRDCSFIEELRVSRMGIDDSDLEGISDLKLVHFEATDNNLKDLHYLKNMKTLTFLDLSGCPINKSGVAVIGSLTNLQGLYLVGTPIGDSDLGALRNLQSLTCLTLYNCPNLTNQAALQLRKWFPKCIVLFGKKAERESGVADIMQLETSLVADGEYGEADLAFKRLIERWQLRQPVPYTWIIMAYRQRALCQVNMNRNDLACRLYVTTLDICAKNAPDDPERPALMVEYADLLEKQGRTQEAQNQRRSAEEIWKEHPATKEFMPEYRENLDWLSRNHAQPRR